MNLKGHDKNYLELNEKYLKSIPLNRNTITDTGWRYRRNIFYKKDSYWGIGEQKSIFYDYKFFNFDVYDKTYYNYTQQRYAKVRHTLIKAFFRLSADLVVHKRSVETVLDWIS